MQQWDDQTIFFVMMSGVWGLLNLSAFLWWNFGI